MRKLDKYDEQKPLLSESSNKTKDQQNSITVNSELAVNSDYGTMAEEDLFLSLTKYYLISEHSNNIKYNVGKYILLTVISGTSIWLFGTTSGLVAGNNLALKILLINGGTILNFFTTFNTSEAFIDYIKSNKIPLELKKFLKPSSNKLEIFAIGSAAFISAGPITLAVFSNTQKITALVITEAVVTQIDNTFIHTFPTLLIAQVPLLRAIFSLPFLPIILCYHFYNLLRNNFSLSQEEIYLKKRQEKKEQNHAKIKKVLINTLETARQRILNDTFKVHWNRRKPWEFQYKIDLPSDLKKIKQLNDITPLLTIASYAPQIQVIPPSTFYSKVVGFVVDTLVGGALYLFGAGFSNVGAIGFYKNALDDCTDIGNYTRHHFSNTTINVNHSEDDMWGWGLSTLPNILDIIMVGYFSGLAFKYTFYNNFISCLKGQFNAPQGFKRYPKTTVTLICLALFFAKYGYGLALYLVQTKFKDPKFDSVRSFLFFCAKYGVPLFLFKNTSQVILNQAVKFAMFFGDDDNKASAALDAKILEMENAIQNAKGDELEKSLKNKPSEQRKQLLRLSEEEFQQLLDHEIYAEIVEPEVIEPKITYYQAKQFV